MYDAPGGTGNIDDITMASFPASVQGVSLEDPFIASGILFILAQLIPQNYAHYEAFQELWSLYDSKVANPPFFGTTLPSMPIASYYDNLMGPDAIPLQYIRMPPDEYIPKIFTDVDFNFPDHLVELYKEASKFFGNSATTESASNANDEPETRPPREDGQEVDGGVETASSTDEVGGGDEVLLSGGQDGDEPALSTGEDETSLSAGGPDEIETPAGGDELSSSAGETEAVSSSTSSPIQAAGVVYLILALCLMMTHLWTL